MKCDNIDSLAVVDPEVFTAISREMERQRHSIELIASENITSMAVLEAQGSVLTNKYAEGYPGKRYYGGCDHVDDIENLAIARAKSLFRCEYANVQPHSGASANQAAFYAFIKPGDTVLGMSLNAGGHLTHGAKYTQSGTWFNVVQYGVMSDGLIDYEEVSRLAKLHKPKLIVAGFSAYSRILDWSVFRKISDEVGAILMIDMAHIAGLVAGGAYPSPIPYADVVTTTTHKTLRGPRGGMILSARNDLSKVLNSAVFPGLQGGPLMHVIAGKAVALKEAQGDDFKLYANKVVSNARAMAKSLIDNGIDIVSGGTDCHLLIADLSKIGVDGATACKILECAGLTANKNAIPNDKFPPSLTSGLRFGSPCGTTRGFGEVEFANIGTWISKIIHALNDNDESFAMSVARDVGKFVNELCCKFPIYSNLP